VGKAVHPEPQKFRNERPILAFVKELKWYRRRSEAEWRGEKKDVLPGLDFEDKL